MKARIGLLIIGLCVAAVLTHAATSAPVAKERWEYGRLSIGEVVDGGRTAKKCRWRTSSVDFEGGDFSDISVKLGKHEPPTLDPIGVMDLLGADGWELVSEVNADSSPPAVGTTQYLFKRLK